MDTEAAQLVLRAITALAAVVWLLGLWFLLASCRLGQKKEDQTVAEDSFEALPRNSLTGSAEVDGEARALATKAALVLASATASPFGPVKIVEKADHRIRFTSVGMGTASWFCEGQLSFTPVGQRRTSIAWGIELTPRNWLLWLGGAFQVAGLIALVTGYWAIDTFFVSSPNPSLQWQTLQMLQVAHFLWPPFLFGALYRVRRRTVEAHLEAWANNLAYLA
jgi:hypothetical protein